MSDPIGRVLFVYGTLMRGFWNHRLLVNGGATFAGEAVTAPGWSIAGESIPYMYPDPFGGMVRGELYIVPEPTLLGPIDALEGHPRHYVRVPVTVAMNGRPVAAEAYTMGMDEVLDRPRIPHGDYRALKERTKLRALDRLKGQARGGPLLDSW